jgi:hypothetical protein
VTDFAQRTIDLAPRNVAEGGRPFATVIVKDGRVLAESANKVAQTNDPTAHAEILAIREACMKLGCSPKEVIFLITRELYEQYYLDDRKYFEVSSFYDEFAKSWDQRCLPMRYEPRDGAVDVYRLWNERNGGQPKSTVVPTT